ncbi:hypothetical protein DPMN_082678 [Dreissena polymorpha]|uniref:Uncharacterized protein n=1 Tax=Dreissena polymorpha TaxID=45954 RepID=A0A9D3Y9P3_DREPO|nr:hypothetical protein DPMN_082678 [Dreissena polymorpha]
MATAVATGSGVFPPLKPSSPSELISTRLHKPCFLFLQLPVQLHDLISTIRAYGDHCFPKLRTP